MLRPCFRCFLYGFLGRAFSGTVEQLHTSFLFDSERLWHITDISNWTLPHKGLYSTCTWPEPKANVFSVLSLVLRVKDFQVLWSPRNDSLWAVDYEAMKHDRTLSMAILGTQRDTTSTVSADRRADPGYTEPVLQQSHWGRQPRE